MYSSTLRGVFPEPKPTHKRNFVKENVTRIKQIQGTLQNSDVVDKKIHEKKIALKKSFRSMSHTSKNTFSPISLRNPRKKLDSLNKAAKIELVASEGPVLGSRISHRAVQTDPEEKISNLYSNGTIMYPSARTLKILKKESPKKQDHGDSEGVVVSNPHNDDVCDKLQRLDVGEKINFRKENILALKNKTKGNSPPDLSKTHQRGTIPKYLKERKEEQKRQSELDPECPPGHVLLPEEERKETLRVLRQSYADRIKELNNMPVSNDTLKKRQRKMAIEDDLKKIEEGIKVFQRPKVFVKINA